MIWRDTWNDKYKFHPFFALVPHTCDWIGCENRFWLERGWTRYIHFPYFPAGLPSAYRCREHGPDKVGF